MRILVADDERPTRHLVESMLLKWGYDVITVKDGAEAVGGDSIHSRNLS